jgi:hypothetical protein
VVEPLKRYVDRIGLLTRGGWFCTSPTSVFGASTFIDLGPEAVDIELIRWASLTLRYGDFGCHNETALEGREISLSSTFLPVCMQLSQELKSNQSLGLHLQPSLFPVTARVRLLLLMLDTGLLF